MLKKRLADPNIASPNKDSAPAEAVRFKLG